MIRTEGRHLSSRSSDVSVMAFMESTINVASSGPRIASMMDGSRVVDGRTGASVDGGCVVVVDCDVAQFSSSFARLSIAC
jgi:hypothetical protein